MNGPQHYKQAEVLLSNAWDHVGGKDGDGPLLHSAEVRIALVAAAQAHATLALVALMTETQIGPQHAWDDIRHAWNQAVRKS